MIDNYLCLSEHAVPRHFQFLSPKTEHGDSAIYVVIVFAFYSVIFCLASPTNWLNFTMSASVLLLWIRLGKADFP